MAVDKFTAVPEDAPVGVEPPADAWKDKAIQKEHTPAKVQTQLTYRQIEKEIAQIDVRIAQETSRKTKLEADLVKIESVAKPSD